MELSGTTLANTVAKCANLLHDGLGAPTRWGLLLPLHWQAVALTLGGVAAGAQVVLARTPSDLAGCDAAVTTVHHAEQAQRCGVADLLVTAAHPLGAPLPPGTALPHLVLDLGRELPGHGDHWAGGPPGAVTVDGAPVAPHEVDGPVRLLLDGTLSWPDLAPAALGALRGGGSLVLVTGGDGPPGLAAQEQVTHTLGPAGLVPVGGP